MHLPVSKTTLLGVGAILGALGHILTSLASGDVSHIGQDTVSIVTAIGLVFAQDSAAK